MSWNIEYNRYIDNNRLCVSVYTDGGIPYAHLSINVPNIPLKEGEFILNHSLNDCWFGDFLDAMLAIFEDTGKRVHYGFVCDQPVWRRRR